MNIRPSWHLLEWRRYTNSLHKLLERFVDKNAPSSPGALPWRLNEWQEIAVYSSNEFHANLESWSLDRMMCVAVIQTSDSFTWISESYLVFKYRSKVEQFELMDSQPTGFVELNTSFALPHWHVFVHCTLYLYLHYILTIILDSP